MTKSSNTKIIQLIKGLDIGGIHGGADLFGFNLAMALKKIYPETQLCIFFKMNTEAEAQKLHQMQEAGLEYFFLTPWSGKTGVVKYRDCLKNLIAQLRKHPAQILHSHFHVGTLIALVMKFLRLTAHVVRTSHADYEWRRGWVGIIKQIIIRMLIFIIFPSLIDLEAGVSHKAVAVLNQRFVARFLKKKAVTIYNSIPINIQAVKKDTQVQQPASNLSPVIGSIGRLTDQKGFTYLLQAVPLVLKIYPQAHFWIIGDGELKDDLHAQAERLGVAPNIKFWGLRDDVSDLLNNMDVFVLASIYEGLPTVILESMAHGVPVIATNIPGTTDIIQHQVNGWCVPAKNPQALAGQIIQVLSNPQQIPPVLDAAYSSLQKFSIATAAQTYLCEYQKLSS
jgi:glycosyltransferase involved in cell wall biosynthesis